MDKEICGIASKKYPDRICCIAYLPKGMARDIGMGFHISDASNSHKHLSLTVLNDGTILSYRWNGKKESWGIMTQGKGSMNSCTESEYENALIKIGKKNKMEKSG